MFNSILQNPDVSVAIDVNCDTGNHNGEDIQHTTVKTGQVKERLSSWANHVSDSYTNHSTEVHTSITVCIAAVYFIYFGFAMSYEFGSQESITLLWITCFGVLCFLIWLIWKLAGSRIELCCQPFLNFIHAHGQMVLWYVHILPVF